MSDFFSFALVIKILTAVALMLFVVGLVKLINSASNELEWADLISVPGRDGGRPRADWNQIGKGLGVVLCVWLPAVYVYSPKMDAGGLAAIMGVSLLYLGGVSAYAATLRSRQSGVTTTTVTEPVPDPLPPQKVTTTTTEPAKPDAQIRQGEVG